MKDWWSIRLAEMNSIKNILSDKVNSTLTYAALIICFGKTL